MSSNVNLDLTQIPITALKKPTVTLLSVNLNSHKVIPNDDGLPRDWRGLAHLIGLTNIETSQLAAMPDPTLALLNQWGRKGNICSLLEFLAVIDRYDVLDDVHSVVEKDSQQYFERENNIKEPASDINLESNDLILTVDDAARLQKGLEPQSYDAFLLYDEEDVEFATEVIETMEKKYSLKLCDRDRDLIGGITFERDAIMKLIAERCRKLIIIVSPAFLKSHTDKFFVTFAQALGIDQKKRKVIPVLYKRCDVPAELSYYFLLDYNRAGKLWNFWDKLRDSIQLPETRLLESSVWTSRTRFQEEATSSTSEEHISKIKNKKSSVYKLFKNSLGKIKTSSNVDVSENKSSETGTSSLLSNLTSLVSNNEVPFENFENSSSFETKDEKKDENSRTKTKTTKLKKKKWFKKRNVESLLS